MIAGTHPILTCAEARELEVALLGGDESREWAAMQRAGAAIAAAVLRDFAEIGGLPADGRILVLVGKGHNGGDALIATRRLLERCPAATAEVAWVFGARSLRPLAQRAWRELMHAAPERVRASAGRLPAATSGADAVPPANPLNPTAAPARPGFDLCLDGVFGFQFRPPCEPRVAALLEHLNALPIRLRAAVDLPSAGVFRADFTYATGSVKTPVLESENAGRIRYLDLGFFRPDVAGVVGPGQPGSPGPATLRVLTPAVLAPLATLRPARCDKRSYGHLFVLGGSRSYPGAVMMAVEAAIRSGAGLVTAFVPETLAAAFAARLPEAIWVGWPETPDGSLALEGLHLLRARWSRADALVVGPGIGREAETLALVTEIVRLAGRPVLLDADALQPEIVRAAKAPLVVTPHAGEFQRLAGETTLEHYATATGATVVLKGPVTRICGADRRPASENPERGLAARTPRGESATVYHSFVGGPVLARGGSGDLLAGMIGAQLAQNPADPVLAAARGVLWHGLAAEQLACASGQVAVHTTQLLDHLGAVLQQL